MENNQEEKKPRRRVKKAKGHGGHHGGAWKVAYADFVTAMMALFLVLWLVSQADVKVKQAIASYFRSPGVFDTIQGGILPQATTISKEPQNLSTEEEEQTLSNVAKALQQQFATRPEFSRYKDQVKIDVTDEGLRVQLIDKADRISFPSGSAKLAEEAELILKEIATAICSLPNKINIGGHTDSRIFPSVNGYTNWELSADRANAARRILEAGCVKPEQIRRIVGFADTELMEPNDPYSPANRRISITVLRLEQPQSKDTEETKSSDQTEVKPENSPNKKLEEKPISNVNKTSDSTEKQVLNNKLQNEGSVVVGESDKVPNKPKIK